jgi:hypothetical protein
MSSLLRGLSSGRLDMLRWIAGIGAAPAEALAVREGGSIASARARLAAAEHQGQLLRHRPLAGKPSLYTVTRAGIRATTLSELEPARVSAANAQHMIACALVAAQLQRRYQKHLVIGEPELRLKERRGGSPLGSAVMAWSGGPRLLHRPDLVLWPAADEGEGPVAVEVELTVKAPRRLAEICRAWARARHISGVVYLAPERVERALWRAIRTAQAEERIVVLPLDALSDPLEGSGRNCPSIPSPL